MVDVEEVSDQADEAELRELIEEHAAATEFIGRARAILGDDWAAQRGAASSRSCRATIGERWPSWRPSRCHDRRRVERLTRSGLSWHTQAPSRADAAAVAA